MGRFQRHSTGGSEPKSCRVEIFQNRVKDWATINGRDFPWRRPNQSFYRQIVTELLLQRTRAESVAAIYDQFFSDFPGWRKLASASVAEVEVKLKCIGLWKRRPPQLIALAQKVLDMGGELPQSRDKLEQIPSVGQYIASAALVLRDIESAPLLDGSMARVLERFFGPRKLADIRYDPYLQELAHKVVDCEKPIIMNWATLDFATLVCKKRKPRCLDCPLASLCQKACSH